LRESEAVVVDRCGCFGVDSTVPGTLIGDGAGVDGGVDEGHNFSSPRIVAMRTKVIEKIFTLKTG
jgi:hypothetical protein